MPKKEFSILELKEILEKLLKAPSPTGFEGKVAKVFAEWMRKIPGLEISTDPMGAVYAKKAGTGKAEVVLTGHLDELGFIVTAIDKDGYLRVQRLGGVDMKTLSAAAVMVHTEKGSFPGVIGKKVIHLESGDERRRVPELKDLYIDLAFRDKDHALEFVKIGDYITFDSKYRELFENKVSAAALDDRTGVLVIGGVQELLAGEKTSANITSIGTPQEEIGTRGANGVARTVGTNVVNITVDVCHSIDIPGLSKDQHADIVLGKGPVIAVGPNVNTKLSELIQEVAKKLSISYQVQAHGGIIGNDAREFLITGAIGIPCRYMHTLNEVCDMTDMRNAILLITEVCKVINDDTSFCFEI